VERQVSSLHRWVERNPDEYETQPLRRFIEAITTVREQDLEISANGRTSIREGVAPERRISIEDAEMRHGRKSRSKRFDGYKEHIARDLDVPAIVACAVTPANRPEEEGARPIADDIERQGFTLHQAHVDRAYRNTPMRSSSVFAVSGSREDGLFLASHRADSAGWAPFPGPGETSGRWRSGRADELGVAAATWQRRAGARSVRMS
jgi:hypothetical protein